MLAPAALRCCPSARLSWPPPLPPQSPALAEAAAELEALRAWAELAEQREAAEVAVEEARGAADAVGQVRND